jgi:transposase-like protein
MICEVMAAEVSELCGPKHDPSSSNHYRGGSASGRVLLEGEREGNRSAMRVRQKSSDGTGCEVELATYRAAKDPQQLQAQIVQAIVSGVSSRAIEEIKPNSPGVKRSNVSRLWQEAGSKFVEQLRGKNLGSIPWCALMLDGIRLSKDQTAVVALGIDQEGNKLVLDFVLGSGENREISRESMRRIVERGLPARTVCTSCSTAVLRCVGQSKNSFTTASFSVAWFTKSETSKANYSNAIRVNDRDCSRVFAMCKGSARRRKCLAS